MNLEEIIFRLKEKYLNKRFLKKNWRKLLKYVLIIAILLSGLIIFLIKEGKEAQVSAIKTAEETQETENTDTIIVDISGEVVSPMVAELPEDSRIEDAIKMAGGLTEKADITTINRAQILADGEKILIPTLGGGTEGAIGMGENQGIKPGTSPSGGGFSGKVNINTADSTTLQNISGVGPATATKIIEYRMTYGRFKSIDDIKNVTGIGEKTFGKMKSQITV